jgi:hypothetical protein
VQFVAAAIPVGATLGLLALLVFGIAALRIARRIGQEREPLFPDAPAERDPLAFTERLAQEGGLDEETARFADVAARSGFAQAYALLAQASAGAVATETRGALATLATLDDEERRFSAFLGEAIPEPPHVPRPESESESVSVPAADRLPVVAERTEPARAPRIEAKPSMDDDLLPSRRWRRRRAA